MYLFNKGVDFIKWEVCVGELFLLIMEIVRVIILLFILGIILLLNWNIFGRGNWRYIII